MRQYQSQPLDERSHPVVVAGKRKTFGKGGNRQKTIMGPVSSCVCEREHQLMGR